MFEDFLLLFIFLGLPAIIISIIAKRAEQVQGSLPSGKTMPRDKNGDILPYLKEYPIEPNFYEGGQWVRKMQKLDNGLELFANLEEFIGSEIICPEGSYNRFFTNITVEEKDDYIIYIGDVFYKYIMKYPVPLYDKHRGVVKEERLNVNRLVAVIKPKFKFSSPNFVIKSERLGEKLPGNRINIESDSFSFGKVFLAGKDERSIKNYFSQIHILDKLKDNLSPYMWYEVYNGCFLAGYSEVSYKARKKINNDVQYVFCHCFADDRLVEKYNLKKTNANSEKTSYFLSYIIGGGLILIVFSPVILMVIIAPLAFILEYIFGIKLFQ